MYLNFAILFNKMFVCRADRRRQPRSEHHRRHWVTWDVSKGETRPPRPPWHRRARWPRTSYRISPWCRSRTTARHRPCIPATQRVITPRSTWTQGWKRWGRRIPSPSVRWWSRTMSAPILPRPSSRTSTNCSEGGPRRRPPAPRAQFVQL